MLIRKTLRVLGIVLACVGAVMVIGTIGLYDTRPEQFTYGQLFDTIVVLLGGIGIAVMAKKSYKF